MVARTSASPSATPQAGDLLDSLLGEAPPPAHAPLPDGWQSHLQARFRIRVEEAGAALAERAARRALLWARASGRYDPSLPEPYRPFAQALWAALEQAERDLAVARDHYVKLIGQSRRLRGRISADLGWLMGAWASFYRLGLVEVLLREVELSLQDGDEALAELEALPRKAAGKLRRLAELLGDYEEATARLSRLAIAAPALERERDLALYARQVIEAVPAALKGDEADALALPPQQIAEAYEAIMDAGARLSEGLRRVRQWHDQIKMIDALREELKRLLRVTALRRRELQAARGAAVLAAQLPQLQRRAVDLINDRRQLDPERLEAYSASLHSAMGYFSRLHEQLVEAAAATEQVRAAGPTLGAQLEGVEGLLAQGAEGSYPIVWDRSASAVSECRARLSTLAQLPELEDLAQATRELDEARRLDAELRRLRDTVMVTLSARDELRQRDVAALARYDEAWAASFEELAQAIARYGPTNWPNRAPPQVSREAARLAAWAAELPQPDRPINEERVAEAVGFFDGLQADIGAFERRVEALRQTLRELDTQALEASRRLDRTQALLSRALAVAPDEQSLRGLLAQVRKLIQRLQPPIKARLDELTQPARQLEQQAAHACLVLAQRLRAECEVGLNTLEQLIAAVQERANLTQDDALSEGSSRCRELRAAALSLVQPAGFDEAVAAIELLAPAVAELGQLEQRLGAVVASVDEHRGAVQRAAQRAHEELASLGKHAAAWPRVEADIAGAERKLRRADQLAEELGACVTLRAYEAQARRACDAYAECCRQIRDEERWVEARREQLNGTVREIESWLSARLSGSESPNLSAAERSDVRDRAYELRERLEKLRHAHTASGSPLSPREIAQELASIQRAIKQEEQRQPIPTDAPPPQPPPKRPRVRWRLWF